MAHNIYQVDAFTDKPFAGNPAAVCILDGPTDPRWMQEIATEVNLSETAFIFKREAGEGSGYGLRWFTPSVEVDLCGHATLASGHVLFSEGLVKENEIVQFYTKSGLLTVAKNGSWLVMNFPADYPRQAGIPAELAGAIGIEPKYVARTKFDYLVEVSSEVVVRDMLPDFGLMREISTRGVIVTAISTKPDFDFVSRFFAPAAGVNEDPVTGSSHCALAAFWGEKLNKTELTGYQASRRGGIVRMSLKGDRVLLSGQAVMIMKGEVL
jgi:PhzF family phenazine biosynthesis protein